MKRYFAALRQALIFEPSASLSETVEGYIRYRSHTVGVLPIFAFVEYDTNLIRVICEPTLTDPRYFYALRLPPEVWEHPEMVALRETGVKMAMM